MLWNKIVKMALYGYVRFERRAVTEFSVTEKETAMNFHKLIKRVKKQLIVELTNCRF